MKPASWGKLNWWNGRPGFGLRRDRWPLTRSRTIIEGRQRAICQRSLNDGDSARVGKAPLSILLVVRLLEQCQIVAHRQATLFMPQHRKRIELTVKNITGAAGTPRRHLLRLEARSELDSNAGVNRRFSTGIGAHTSNRTDARRRFVIKAELVLPISISDPHVQIV